MHCNMIGETLTFRTALLFLISGRKEEDRLAAVSPKSDQVFCSGSCESNRAVPRPTPSPPAE
jgi:hypothetical protein